MYKISFLLLIAVSVLAGCHDMNGEISNGPKGAFSFLTTYNKNGGEFSGSIDALTDFKVEAFYWLMARHPTKEQVDFLRKPGESRYNYRQLTNDERTEFIRLTTPERIRHYYSTMGANAAEIRQQLNQCVDSGNRGNYFLYVSFENLERQPQETSGKNGTDVPIVDLSSAFASICWSDVTKVEDPMSKEFINYFLEFKTKRLKEVNAPLD